MAFLLLAGLLIGWDLLLKEYAEKALEKGKIKPVCRGYFCLEKVHNRGVVGEHLSRYSEQLRKILPLLTGVALLRWLFAMIGKAGTAVRLGYTLIFAGAAGNTIDRYRNGYVTDYLRLNEGPKCLKKKVGNLADICLFLGLILALLPGRKK